VRKLWNKDFVLLLQGNVVSTVGDLMYSVAIGYWVYEQTGSSGLMGVMSAISMFVTMFVSPFSGSVVDKCNRKWVLTGMDILQAVVMLGIGLLAYLDKLSVTGVLIAAFLAALGSVFYSPAVSTLMIDIIPDNDMVRGQSIFSGTNALINMIGTALSGVMVAFLGVPFIVVLNGLSNLYSAVSEMFIHVPRTIQQGTKVSVKNVLRDSKAAVKEIFSNPCLRVFVPGALILNLLAAGPLSLLLPFCMEKGFTVDMYGYLMSAWTAAGVICTLLLGVIKLKPKTRFYVMAVGFSASGIFLIFGFLTTNFLLMCGLAFVGAFLNCAGNTVFNASLMLALPEKNRGAILGFIQSASVGGMALSAVIYGFLGEIFPLYVTFAIGNALSLPLMIYMCFHPRTKQFIMEHGEAET
jgi:MFS family permease